MYTSTPPRAPRSTGGRRTTSSSRSTGSAGASSWRSSASAASTRRASSSTRSSSARSSRRRPTAPSSTGTGFSDEDDRSTGSARTQPEVEKPSCEGSQTTRSCQRNRKFPGSDGVRKHCTKFRRGCVRRREAEAGRPHCRRDERPKRGPHHNALRAVSRIPSAKNS